MIDTKPYMRNLDMVNEYVKGMIEVVDYRRRAGSTTRIADLAIQMLFKYGETIIRDSHRPNGSMQDQDHLMKIVLKRLANEHGLTNTNGIIVNRDKMTIKIKK